MIDDLTRFLNANRRGSRKHAVSGFTLIELMIVVAVVAVLAAIAYPSFQDALRKSRRGQAKADLVEYVAAAERFRTVNNTYVGFGLPGGVDQSPREPGSPERYSLAITTQDVTDIVISATAVADQANDRCGDLSLASTGAKTESGSAELSDCW